MTAHSPSPKRAAFAHAVLVVLLAATTALALSSSATAATPCGKAVLADWFDNSRIDRLYELPCYEEAIAAIPEEIRVYGDAEEVIARALQEAVHSGISKSGDRGPPDSREEDDPVLEPTTAPAVDTSAPSAFPLPLLVLGGMSLVLLGAGGLGYLSRRRRDHRLDNSADADDLEQSGRE